MRLGLVGCAVRTKHLPAELVRTAHPTHIGPARWTRVVQAPHTTTNGCIAYGLGLRMLGYRLPGWLRRTA